jgi:hypothetical protein
MSKFISKFVKVTAILAVAVVSIAARQAILPGIEKANAAASTSVSPELLMRAAGPLTETPVESYF